MYLPSHFEESRPEALHDLMRQHPLATLVALTSEGLTANHIPLHLDVSSGPPGILSGHVARANPLWREAGEGTAVLAIFHGPQAYVSPSWYPSKAESGKVVPTWNYAVVHAHGRLSVRDDASWLRAQMEVLTSGQESAFPHPWHVADAPADYIEHMIRATVGIEIAITRLEGKWKTSQNQSAQNRAGVTAGLTGRGDEDALAMAEWVRKCGA